MTKIALSVVGALTIICTLPLYSMDKNIKTLAELHKLDPQGIAAGAFLEQTGRNLAAPSLGRSFLENAVGSAGQSFAQQAAAPVGAALGDDLADGYQAGKQAVRGGWQWLKEMVAGNQAKAAGLAQQYPLHNAVARNNFAAIIHLIKQKASIDAQDPRGDTPLMIAVSNDNQELVAFLLAEHANRAIKNKNDETALAIARKLGLENIAALLHKKPSVASEKFSSEDEQPVERKRPHSDNDQEEQPASKRLRADIPLRHVPLVLATHIALSGLRALHS